jgi:hypothetical protein
VNRYVKGCWKNPEQGSQQTISCPHGSGYSSVHQVSVNRHGKGWLKNQKFFSRQKLFFFGGEFQPLSIFRCSSPQCKSVYVLSSCFMKFREIVGGCLGDKLITIHSRQQICNPHVNNRFYPMFGDTGSETLFFSSSFFPWSFPQSCFRVFFFLKFKEVVPETHRYHYLWGVTIVTRKEGLQQDRSSQNDNGVLKGFR